MSRTRWQTWALVVSLLFNIAFVAAYLTHRMARAPVTGPPGPFLEEMRHRVGLTDSQWERFLADREALSRHLERPRGLLGEDKTRLWELLAQDEPDQGAIKELASRIALMQAEAQEMILESLMNTRRTLSPEQRKGFDEVLHGQMCPNVMCGAGCMSGCSRCGGGDR